MKTVSGRQAKAQSRWVELEGGVSYWNRGGARLVATPRDEERILQRFIALEDGDPKKLCEFIDLYGILNLCQHGVPAMHPPFSDQTDACDLFGNYEFTRVWKICAEEARGILGLIHALKKPKGIGTARDWEALWLGRQYRQVAWKRDLDWFWRRSSEINAANMLSSTSTKEMRQHEVARSVNILMRYASIQPEIVWEGETARMTMGNALSVTGKIAQALSREMAGKAVPVTCRGCGELFRPSRAGWRFCEACRDDGVPNRVHVAEHRAKKRVTKRAKRTS